MMPMVKALRKAIKRVPHPLQVMPVCVRCCASNPLGSRHIEEAMA